MRTALLLAVAVAAMIMPAAFAANPAQTPADHCNAHPELVGTGNLYIDLAACVTAQAAKQQAYTSNAAKSCKAEMADANFAASHGGKTFAQVHGTHDSQGNGKGEATGTGNAFGKCVSVKASAKTTTHQTATVNAAKACKTDAALKAQIGAGKTYRNFGGCVTAQAKKQG
jgi:hypothetical protein